MQHWERGAYKIQYVKWSPHILFSELIKIFWWLDLALRGSEFYPLRAVPYGIENHFYHIMWSPLNVTIFITHVRNCVIEATPVADDTFLIVQDIYIR